MRSLLLALLVAACSGQRGGPEAAVQQLISSARTGDRVSVYQRLGPETRNRILALQTTSRRSSGRLVMKPDDFLSVGWAPPAWEPAGMRTLHREGDSAEVEVYSASGERHAVRLVREGGEWKIELPGR